jgi:hypothetical protein
LKLGQGAQNVKTERNNLETSEPSSGSQHMKTTQNCASTAKNMF